MPAMTDTRTCLHPCPLGGRDVEHPAAEIVRRIARPGAPAVARHDEEGRTEPTGVLLVVPDIGDGHV